MRALLLALLLPLTAHADSFQSACFSGGINDTDAPAVINNCEGQDMLDMETNLSGTSLIKRKGYAKSADLAVSTAAPNGRFSFTDASGNRVDIVCQDRNCSKSTNGGAFSVFHTTAAAGVKRWSWVAKDGIAYGANDKYDTLIKLSGGSTTTVWGAPQGSLLALTQSRLAVSDITGQPSRVYYSSAGAVENFTLGVNTTDPYYDDLGSPGDKVTGLLYLDSILYVWKTTSLTACELADQYSSVCTIISPTIGTGDPGSIVAAGSSIYFKAQDKTYWELRGGKLRLLSTKISNLIKSQNQGGERTNTQTSQSDWQAGVQYPTGTWNTTNISGSIFPSSFTAITTSSADFALGTVPASLTLTSTVGQVQFATAAWRIPNGDFETGNLLYFKSCTATGGTCDVSATAAIDGAYGARVYTNSVGSNVSATVEIRDGSYTQSGGTSLYSVTYAQDSRVLIGGLSINLYALGLSTRTLYATFTAFSDGSSAVLQTSTFTSISSFTWSAESGGGFGWGKLDTIRVNRYFSHDNSSATAVYYSPVYDTGFSTATGGPFVANLSSETATAIVFSTRTSLNSGGFVYTGAAGGWGSISSGTRINNLNQTRYVQWLSTFSTTVGTQTPVLYDTSLAFATTGFYKTQCIQPNSAITSWGIFSCAATTGGMGSLVYYATSTASCATLTTAVPTDLTKWPDGPITNNATLTIATNTAVMFAWRSLLGSSTDQAQVDACTVYWNEGTPAQPTWAAYDSIKNAVYWNTTVNNAAYSNRLLKYDINNDSWWPWSVTATAPIFINNSLYFGGASSGTWNLFGGNDSDNGGVIPAFWKGKDIGGENPFNGKNFMRTSVLARNQGSGTISVTPTWSQGKTDPYSISLSTTAGLTYIRSIRNLATASPTAFLNLKFSNTNANEPFEVLGYQVEYTPAPLFQGTGP